MAEATALLESGSYLERQTYSPRTKRLVETPAFHDSTQTRASDDFEPSAVVKLASPREALTSMVGPQRQQSVRLAVREVEGAVARCGVQVGGQDLTIQLSTGLFPEHPRFGMTFELRMVVENGVRRPDISRSLNVGQELSETKSRIRLMLEGL